MPSLWGRWDFEPHRGKENHLALTIAGLSKTYPNGVQALKNLSLTIGNNMFGLLGPNGAGKSTLMRTVATLQDPDSGTISLDGIDVLKDKDAVRQRLGYLPQEFGVYPKLSALDMLNHLAVLKGVARASERRDIVDALLKQTNLWDARKKALGTFSGGMKQRLGIAQAHDLSPDGKWILLSSDDMNPSVLSLLPVAAGAPRTVSVNGLAVEEGRWLHDGKHVVIRARPEDRQARLYVVPLEEGAPTPLAGAAVGGGNLAVSRDDHYVAARSSHGTLTLFSLDGGTPIPLPELGKSAVAAGWATNTQLWVRMADDMTSIRLLRFDIGTRSVLEERRFSPTESTGLFLIGIVNVAPDGRGIAFDYWRVLGNLYILDGLAPPRR